MWMTQNVWGDSLRPLMLLFIWAYAQKYPLFIIMHTMQTTWLHCFVYDLLSPLICHLCWWIWWERENIQILANWPVLILRHEDSIMSPHNNGKSADRRPTCILFYTPVSCKPLARMCSEGYSTWLLSMSVRLSFCQCFTKFDAERDIKTTIPTASMLHF